MPRILGNASAGVIFYARLESYIDSLCVAPLTQQNMIEVSLIKDAKQMASGTLVSLHGKVVTALTTDGFYMEEVDRSSSVKVVSTAAVHVGDVVDVTGVIGACDGEREITTGAVTAMGVAGDPIKPYGMQGDALGGAALGSSVPGVTGGHGANNIGLLVKSWGTVSSVASGYFYMDSSPGTSIKIKSGTLLQPKVGDIISVVGVCTCEVSGGSICRAILPRTQADIVVAKPAP